MEDDRNVNLGLNLGLSYSVAMMTKPGAPDADSDSARLQWPVAVMTGHVQKVEREDPGYGEASSSHSTGQHIPTAALEECMSAMSEDEFVLYNAEDSKLVMRQKLDQTRQSESVAVVQEKNISLQTKSDGLQIRNEQDDNGLPIASNKKRPDGSFSTPESCGQSLSESQRSVDEVDVVMEEGLDEFEDGEIIKELDKSHHGTNSETFLSQMHFFGGRTWARGRGRGCGRGRDITNIALKLIETDQAGTNGEHRNSVDEVDHMMPATSGVQSRRGKSGDCKSSPPLMVRKSERLAAGSAEVIISPSLKTEQPSSSASRKEAVTGRERSLGSKPFKRKQSFHKTKTKTLHTTDNSDGLDYESNDEDTLAAIRASLEEMNKNTATVDIDSSKDEKPLTKDDEKQDATTKSNRKKMNSFKKGEKATEKTFVRSGHKKKTGCTNKRDKLKNMKSKQNNEQKAASEACYKAYGQNSYKNSRGKTHTTKETANSIGPDEEVVYESNDEDTQAAIQASLEELEKEKLRKRERELEKQELDKQTTKRRKWSKQKKLVSPAQSLVKEEGRCMKSVRSNSSSLIARASFSGLQSRSRSVSTVFKKGERHSSRSSFKPLTATARRATCPDLQDPIVSYQTQQKMEKEKLKTKKRIQCSVRHKGKKKASPSHISDFDSVGDSKEKLDSHLIMLDSIPVVQMQKIDLQCEHIPKQCSSGSKSSLNQKLHLKVSDGDQGTIFQRTKLPGKPTDLQYNSVCNTPTENSSADQIKASQYPTSSKFVTALTPSLHSTDLPSSEGKEDSLTKSVGGMMSHLFGDKLAEECPDGFVVNVRLEVEKKKGGDDRCDGGSNQCGVGCKSRQPELCPCLQKVSESKMAAVLKEKVENRRDLSLSAKGALLAAILNFIQELETASLPQ